MSLPGTPGNGASGGIPFAGDQPPVGPHEEVGVQPTHGADNGADVDFWLGAKFNDPHNAGSTGMKVSHPSFGGV
jgi:hypothetical protein